MPRAQRYLGRKFMESSRSSTLNWERQFESRLLVDHGTCRYHHVSGAVVRNPSMRPLLNNGRKNRD